MSNSEVNQQYFRIIAVVDEIRQQMQSHKDGIFSMTDYEVIRDGLSPFSNVQKIGRAHV